MTQRELDIPEFLKGQTKEYIRIEKSDYKNMIKNFDQARRLAFTRGLAVGLWSMAIVCLIIFMIVWAYQSYSFGVLPMAGP